MPIQVFLFAVARRRRRRRLRLGAARRRPPTSRPDSRKVVRANLGPSVAPAPDMREVVLAQPAWERVGRAGDPQVRADSARKLTPAGLLDALEQRRNYAGLDAKWTLERLLAIKVRARRSPACCLGLLVFLPEPDAA